MILVTGGHGFIGGNLVAYLRANGEDVVAPTSYEMDVRSLDDVQEYVGQADVIYHLAGQVAMSRSLTDPAHDFEVNAQGTVNVLEAARQGERNPIVVCVTSNKIYGQLDVPLIVGSMRYDYAPDFPSYTQGISEQEPIDPCTPYGCSKATASHYIREYHASYGLRAIDFRLSCTYGPGQRGSEAQGWVAHFVSSMIHSKPLTIYGDGKQTRDLLHVNDLCRAFVMATGQIEATAGQAYNIGGGPENALSLLELVAMFPEHKPRPAYGPWRVGDQRCYISDIRKAKRDFGWAPETGIAEGLAGLHSWLNR